VGRPIVHIVSNLQYEGLVKDAQEVLQTLTSKEVQLQTREGNRYVMRILPYRTVDNVIDGVVVTFIDINALRRSAELLNKELVGAQTAIDARLIGQAMREPVLMLNAEKRVIGASPAFYSLFGLTPTDTEGRLIFEMTQRGWDGASLRKLLYEALPQQKEVIGFKLTEQRPDGSKRPILTNAHLIEPQDGDTGITLLTFEDITAGVSKSNP